MTGSAWLSQKLKFPKVVKSIKLGQDLMIFKSCPRLLNDFASLEELSIHSCSGDWSTKLNLSIDVIPSGVTKLVLSGKWNSCVDKLFGEEGASLKLNEHLPKLEALEIRSLIITSNSWMLYSPQSLTKLGLYRWDGTVELPSSLIHFEASLVELSKSSFVSKLPSSLESFVAASQFVGADLVVPLLPPSTRKFYLGNHTDFSSGLLDQLPKLMTQLRLQLTEELDLEENPELTSLLPTTLTELEMPLPVPCSAWPLLPQKLEILDIESEESICTVESEIIDEHGEHHGVSSIPFDFLPRSITSLAFGLEPSYECHFCGPPAASIQSFFPPQLTQLKIRNVQLSPQAAKFLPSSLTILKIGNLCEQVCQHLPASLRTLKSNGTLMSPNLIKFLPKSLTYLHLSISDSDDTWFDYNTGESIDPLSDLPEYSIHEECLSNSFDWTDSSPLPPKLTRLELEHADELGDSFLFHHQLPTLQHLNLQDSLHFSDVSIPLLSSHLTSLNLENSSMISGKSFQFLPRCLSYINLDSSKSIFDSDIQHLPRTLKCAYFGVANDLTEKCLPDLPHLDFLSLRGNMKISSSFYASFPCSLLSSQSPGSVELHGWSIQYGEICIPTNLPKLR